MTYHHEHDFRQWGRKEVYVSPTIPIYRESIGTAHRGGVGPREIKRCLVVGMRRKQIYLGETQSTGQDIERRH